MISVILIQPYSDVELPSDLVTMLRIRQSYAFSNAGSWNGGQRMFIKVLTIIFCCELTILLRT